MAVAPPGDPHAPQGRQPSKARHRLRRLPLLAVALALLVWGASCSSSSNSSTDPTTGAGGSKAPIAVDLTAAGCAPSTLQVDAGTIELLLSNRTSSQATRFQITNGDGRVIADVSNVLGGLTRTVKAKLDEGSYTMTCGSNAGQIIASAP